MSSVMRKFRRKNRKCDEFQITASVTSLSLECETKDWFPWQLAIVWDRTNPKLSSTKPVQWQGGLQSNNRGVYLWEEPNPVQNKLSLFKNSGKERSQYKSKLWEILIQNVSPSGKRKVIAVGSLDMSEYIKEEPASHDISVTLRPVKKSVLSCSLQFILSSIMLEDGIPRQFDKEVLDEFMRDAMELRKQSLQKASSGKVNSSKSSLQEASGSKAPMADTAAALQGGAATKASGPQEAASCSNNSTSGQRKVKRKLLTPTPSTKSRPAPPPPPRAVSQSAQPATSRPPRPPPPSVRGAKRLSKQDEEKASKDGSSRRSARPHKSRSGVRTKDKYPKDLNPFGSDTSLPSSEKISKCDFPPELNPFSEESNDEQASSSEGDNISSDVKQCDNEHSKTKFTQEEPGELQDVKIEKCSKLKEGDGHCSASELGTSVSNDISNDGTQSIIVESVEPSPSGKQASMQEEEEASTSSGVLCILVRPVDSCLSGKEAPTHVGGSVPDSTMPEALTSVGETSVPVMPEVSSTSLKPAVMQKEERTPSSTVPEAPTSGGETSNPVKPEDSSLSGRPSAMQTENRSPNTTTPEVSTSGGYVSIHVELVDFPPSGKEAPLKQEVSTPNTTLPEISTSSGDASIHVEPADSPPSGTEVPMLQEKSTAITTMSEASTSGGDTSFPVKPADSSPSGKEAADQQQESTHNTTVPETAAAGEASSIPKVVESSPSCNEVPVQHETIPIATVPETLTSSLACVNPEKSGESFPCSEEGPMQEKECTTMSEASNSSEVLSVPVMHTVSSLSRKEPTVQQDEGTLNNTVPKAAVSCEARSIPVEFVESCSSDKEGPFHQEESAPSTATLETLTSSDGHSNSAKISPPREAPLQEGSTPNAAVREVSTCSEDCSIPVVEASPSEKKTPLHQEQRACSTADRVASRAFKCGFLPAELNPFSEEYTDEHGSLSEGDTISSDLKQCYYGPSKTTSLQEEPGELQDVKGGKCNTAARMASTAREVTGPHVVVHSDAPEEGVCVQGNQHENEAASLIIEHCPELFSSIDEDVYLLQEEIASAEKVSIRLELEMQEAIKVKDCEEELDGLSQDWIGVANYRTELIRRKQHLQNLATEKNLEECINGLRQELKYSLELEGWRKSEKNKVRDRLLLDALVSFVRRRDTGLKF